MDNPLALLIRGIRILGLKPTWAGVVHTIRTRWVEAKYADPQRPLRGMPLLKAFLRRLSIPLGAFPPPGPIAFTPGPLLSYREGERTLQCHFTNATLTIKALAPDLIRFSWQSESSGLTQQPAPGPEALEFRTDRLTCHISSLDGRLTITDANGAPVAEEIAPASWTTDGRLLLRWKMPPDAHFYGLGERAAPLDLRGGVYTNWNTDPRTYGPGDDPLYLCVPFLLALHSGGDQAFGLLLENSTRSRFDLGRTDPGVITVELDESKVDWLFFYAPTVSRLVERFTEETGRHPLFPLWTLGYHQSRWSYYPEERVRRLARDFRETCKVPCDVIHLDIHYMDGYRVFTWDRRRFPDPAGLIADLHAQGFKVVTIIDPGVKADQRYWVLREGVEQKMFCYYPDGRLFMGPVWPGDCAFPDFTDPRVREWWGDLHRELVEMGVDGIWDDMNEPALFGERGATIPDPVCHSMEGKGGNHRQAHNLYGLNMARATAEGLARLRPDRRPFVITRSGWTGVQRYSAHWTGDSRSDWASLRQTLPMVLNLGLSGIAFTGSDIGGFEGVPTGELFTRWLQMSVFFPFCRAHTSITSPDQEPWSWGEPYLSINREFIQLRYRLLPYLYTALWQCTQTGIPIVRPLLLDFQKDPITQTLDDEFLCGDALLVAPVLEEGATKRRVYLPAGHWYDFWTDSIFEGPAWIEADAPLERIPVFVRAGTVIPQGPEMDYVGHRPTNPLVLHLYPPLGEQEMTSFLYEDDGETLAYKRGEYLLHRFSLSRRGGEIFFTWFTEGAFTPHPRRTDAVVHWGEGLKPACLIDIAPGQISIALPFEKPA